jgi:hypothetical protein
MTETGILTAMEHERTSEEPKHVSDETPDRDQLEVLVEAELARYAPPNKDTQTQSEEFHVPVRDAPPHEPTPDVREPIREPRYGPERVATTLGNVPVVYGREVGEIVRKEARLMQELAPTLLFWRREEARQKALLERLQTKPLEVAVHSNGMIKVHDGNTTLFAALKRNIAPEEIRVKYTLPSKWGGDEPEYQYATLAELAGRIEEFNTRSTNS